MMRKQQFDSGVTKALLQDVSVQMSLIHCSSRWQPCTNIKVKFVAELFLEPAVVETLPDLK